MGSEQKTIYLNDKWLKATVIGSLWAAFEIIVGSLLHNLRMPFAGTILSAFAVIFMVTFFQLWKEKGIIFRAGLICALMKSVSPSAVILGPMIGIITEALLLEILVASFGNNLFSYILGGGIAVLSALLHKVGNLILLYSFDLVKVYLNMVNFAANKFGLPESTAGRLLLLLSAIYFLAGSIAALIGYMIGKKAGAEQKATRIIEIPDPSFTTPKKGRKLSVLLLLLHILILSAGLYLSSGEYRFYLKIGLPAIYLVICFSAYRNLYRRFLKPLFWIQLIVILILASVFLNYGTSKEFSFSFAIQEGLIMFFRALLVITSFSAISRELSNPLIRNFLVRNGFHNLYLAIQVAFEILPLIIELNSGFKAFLKHPLKSFGELVSDSNLWLDNLKIKFTRNQNSF